jgi:hypothetical protein
MRRPQLVELLARLRNDLERGEPLGPRLCEACVELFEVSGAAIMLMGDDGNTSALAASDDGIRAVEDLQFTLGEGPGIEAHVLGRPALVPNLAEPGTRWTTFGPAARELGVQAASGLGALDLYSNRPTVLHPAHVSDALVLAGVVTQAVLSMQAGAPDGQLPHEIDQAGGLRAEVHQASGMMSEELEIGIVEALVRLRASAYAQGRSINDIARDVVTRRVAIDDPAGNSGRSGG